MVKENFVFLAKEIKQHCKKAKTIVDVGCGDGSFLKYLKTQRPALKRTGLDLLQGYDITRKYTLPKRTFDVVTMTGVHSEFETIYAWIYNLLGLGTYKSTYFVMGYFNPNPIDVVTLYKETFETRYRRNGFNIPSMQTVIYELVQLKRTWTFQDFQLSKPIHKDPDPKRVWTFKNEDGHHLQTNGVCQLVPFKLLTIFPHA